MEERAVQNTTKLKYFNMIIFKTALATLGYVLICFLILRISTTNQSGADTIRDLIALGAVVTLIFLLFQQ